MGTSKCSETWLDKMPVLVLRDDGYYAYVEPHFLDYLVEVEEIINFCRDRGPGTLRVDPVRSSQEKPYVGSERRSDTSIKPFKLSLSR